MSATEAAAVAPVGGFYLALVGGLCTVAWAGNRLDSEPYSERTARQVRYSRGEGR